MLNNIVKQLLGQFPLFIFICLSIIFPACLVVPSLGTRTFVCVGLAIAYALVLTIIASYRHVVRRIIVVTTCLITCAEFFTYFHLGTRVKTTILILILQTNFEESADFMFEVSTLSSIIKSVTLTSLCFLLWVGGNRYWQKSKIMAKVKSNENSIFFRTLFTLVLLLFCGSTIFNIYIYGITIAVKQIQMI